MSEVFKATKNKVVLSQSQDNDVYKATQYKQGQNNAIASKDFISSLLPPKASTVKEAIKYVENDIKSKTTIPSVDYDEDYAKAVGIVKTEATLQDKMLLDSAKKKQINGEQLTVAELGTLLKYEKSTDNYKQPQNKSQAYLLTKEMDAENLANFEKHVRSSEDFMLNYNKGYFANLGSEEKNEDDGGFLKNFVSDYNISDQNKATTGITDKKLYKQIKNREGIYKFLTADEREIYYYLAGKGDNDTILNYINSKKPELESRKALSVAEENDRDGFWGGVKNTVNAATTGFENALVNQARSGVAGGFSNGTLSADSPLLNLLDPTYKEKLYSEISKKSYDKNFVYGLWLDIVNNTTAQIPDRIMGAVGGQGAYITSLAQKLIGQSTTDAINQGEEAYKGILKGSILTALEYLPDLLFGGMSGAQGKLATSAVNSISKTISNPKVVKLLSKAVVSVISMVGEGAEEFFQEFAEPVVNNIVFNKNEKYDEKTFGNAIKAFLIGFFSAGPASVSNANNDLVEMQKDSIGKDLKDLAGIDSVLSLAETAENTSELYYNVKGKYDAGRNVENIELADLYLESAQKFASVTPETMKAVAERNVEALIKSAKEYTENKHRNAESLAVDKNSILQSTANAQATSEDGAASFMPENVKEIALSNQNKKRHHTTKAEQDYIIGIGKMLGRTVVFEDVVKELGKQGIDLNGQIPDGYIDKNNVIHINYTVVNPVTFILKHELTHFGEGTEAYKRFVEIIKGSKVFKDWLKKKTGLDPKKNSLEVMIATAREDIMSSRDGEAAVDVSGAMAELIADFVGDCLFIESGSGLNTILNDLNVKERNEVIQFILDFLSYLKKKLAGDKDIVFEISRLEDSFNRMLSEATQSDTSDTKKAANNSGGVKYSLNSYTEHQIKNWENSKNIVVYKNEQQLRQFIFDAQKGINLNKKMYFGAVSQELADRIKKDTGLDVSAYNCTLRASEVRKIFNDHGDEKTENLRGQRAITEEDFLLIPQIVQNPDEIILSDKLFEGKPVIHFIKTINGKTTIAAYVSSKHLDLTVQTMYSGKNKGNLSIAAGEQAPANTPEANAGTVSNNKIPHSEDSVNSNSMQENKKYSIPTDAEDLLERYDSGKISREELIERLDDLWNESNAQFGSIEQGENAKLALTVPKQVSKDKFTERFVRTFIETGKLTPEMIEDVELEILLGDTYSYNPLSDDKAQKNADRYFEKGIAEDTWNQAINIKGVGKNEIAIGEKLLLQAIESNNRLRVLEISAELSDVLTRAGQTVQAARMLKEMSGVGRLVAVQRNVKTINKDLEEKYGKKAPKITIDPTLAKQLAEAKSKEEIDMVDEEIKKDIASQVPITFLDKWNAWRYFAMLSNPKTHIRNLVGNTIFTPAVRIKDILATGMEAAFVNEENRTKSLIIQKEYAEYARADGKKEEVKQLLKGNKYNDKTALKENQRIFKTKALEFLTQFNSNALEFEDMLFKNKHYIHALAGYLQARNVDLKTVSEDVLANARIYAVNEARKATFNDESALANWVQNFGNKNIATNIIVEGVLPFKRTPINIVKRGIEYSPIGLVKTLAKGTYDVKKGKITPTEFIDGLASGLTGTGIMLAGMILANLGCVSGGKDDDDESDFEKMLGKQEYAIEFFGKSYSIDWAAPACIPFFIGVEIVDTVSEGEDFHFADVSNAVWNSLEPITNLSMLSGMQGVIESARYADSSQTLAAIAGDAITSYSMQGIPSLFGAVSRTIDPMQRSWYTDKNSKAFDSFSQSVINNIKSKIPGLSYTQIPKIDAWGRVVDRGNVGERLFENFVSPGYYSELDYTETNEELKRIFVKTGGKVFPKTAAKSFQVDGETKHLTADEYVIFAKAKGEYSYDYIHEFMSNKAYKRLSDEERTKVIENLYEYANAKAKCEVSDYDLTKSYKTVTNWERNGGSAVDYYISRAISK